MWQMERRYSVPPSTLSDPSGRYHTTEDLHAWSIYRQNLNSDFTDSALGSSEKSQPPFGNFQLRESTVHTILNHPKYGPRERQSELGTNIYTYLRFGLPRVFPHGKPLKSSSGYDSSDDGSPFLDPKRRTRSDPDFRSHFECMHRRPPAQSIRASSELDLKHHTMRSERKHHHIVKTQHELKEGYHTNPMPHSDRRSTIGSHLSVNSRSVRGENCYGQDPYVVNDKYLYYAGHQNEVECPLLRHPHLQVRELTYEVDMSSAWHTLCGGARTKLRLLDNLSFEARAGDILAIMSTTDDEGTAVLDILGNRHKKWRCRLRGDFLINGLYMTPSRLEQCLSYVQRDPDFTSDMSVRQTMLFNSLLLEPDHTREYDIKTRINALLEDLGLGQVKHTRVRDLTDSEKRRLNVACHLLFDTDIVLLDQPTKGMDIFDTFFLVEFLRQWAARGRIVILTIHIPTYEIFTMISKVALISTGRMLYFGKRKDMLPYFAYIDFPCPAFKNPSDYYLDLVTLDNLSAEALLESSQRVENLVEIFRRRQDTLSDPGPPGLPPPTVKKVNVVSQILALWIRVLIYMFPFNVIYFCRDVFLAALMSVLIGAIYWNIRAGKEQADVSDRFGFYYVIMALSIWPLILNCTTDIWEEKLAINRDIREGLYGKFTYVLCKLTYSLPVTAIVFTAYCVPAYSMAGLQTTSRVHAFTIYIAYMLFYLFTIRMLAIALSWACSSRHVAAIWTGIILMPILTTAGYTVHFDDLSIIVSWLQWLSPARWMIENLLSWEFNKGSISSDFDPKYVCSYNPIIKQNTILARAECGIVTDHQALSFYKYLNDWPLYQPVVITIAFHIIFLLIGLFAFLLAKQTKKQRYPIT